MIKVISPCNGPTITLPSSPALLPASPESDKPIKSWYKHRRMVYVKCLTSCRGTGSVAQFEHREMNVSTPCRLAVSVQRCWSQQEEIVSVWLARGGGWWVFPLQQSRDITITPGWAHWRTRQHGPDAASSASQPTNQRAGPGQLTKRGPSAVLYHCSEWAPSSQPPSEEPSGPFPLSWGKKL